MSSVYTPSAVVLGNVTLPSDGDARSAASVNVPLQAIADGVKYNATAIASEATARAAAITTEAASRVAGDAVQAARKTILDVQQVALATTFTSTSTSYVDVTGLTLSLSCGAGDILLIDASILLSALDFISAKVMITDGGGSIDPTQVVRHAITEWSSGNVVGVTTCGRSFKYVVVNTGSITVNVKAKVASGTMNVMGTASTDSAGSTIRVTRIGL